MVDNDIKQHMLRTYVSLRRLLAVVTTALLVTLVIYRIFYSDTENSISAYYYNNNNDLLRMNDVFVATLTAIGLLLIAYQGYTNKENGALNLSGVALVCAVIFPMDIPRLPKDPPAGPLSPHAYLHYASAIIFFFGLVYVSLCRSHDTLSLVRPEFRRSYRNAYRVTGGMMLVIPLLAIGLQLGKVHDSVFWLEFAGIVAFLAYWVVKSVELETTGAESRENYKALPKTPPA